MWGVRYDSNVAELRDTARVTEAAEQGHPRQRCRLNEMAASHGRAPTARTQCLLLLPQLLRQRSQVLSPPSSLGGVKSAQREALPCKRAKGPEGTTGVRWRVCWRRRRHCGGASAGPAAWRQTAMRCKIIRRLDPSDTSCREQPARRHAASPPAAAVTAWIQRSASANVVRRACGPSAPADCRLGDRARCAAGSRGCCSLQSNEKHLASQHSHCRRA